MLTQQRIRADESSSGVLAASDRATQSTDWTAIARLLLRSRALDDLEEQELVPQGHIRYQFSARGHELAQILLALMLGHPHDAATAYYRSRPFMLAAGLDVEEALAGSMAHTGSRSQGRDIGVVFNLPSRGGPTVLPMTGDVGGQYTPAAGWAQTICYRRDVLGEQEWNGAVAVVMGGDGSVATPGFWSAIKMATTLALPMLFFIEDNGYAISVPSTVQVPGGDIIANLHSYQGILLLDGDGTDPLEASDCIGQALAHVRAANGPALLRLRVPRLNGHSFTDNQAYKDGEERAHEWEHDPLVRLRAFLLAHGWDEAWWEALATQMTQDVRTAAQRAMAHPDPEPTAGTRFVFAEPGQPQEMGGLSARRDALNTSIPAPADVPSIPNEPGARINMVDAIRQTLARELELNPRMVIFGEDVGLKGGVHGATRDLQRQFGVRRVFDTSLCEEGIIGRAVGMALGGLLPVPEIQFRKYLDPAMEQIADCGTMRWRTHNCFAAPMVLRIPVGFSKHAGDPWHSICGEASLARRIGWQVVFASNATDAVGLLRSALRGNNPVFFLEHRALLDTPDGRRPYPGDDYIILPGQAAVRQTGDTLTIITWGAMVQRCVDAALAFPDAVEILDLRTIVPWDREAVLQSVRKTGRCLIVHEDTATAGFGAEVAATIAQDAFGWLDAPVARLTTPDCPVPYNRGLMESVIPSVERIKVRIGELIQF